MALTIDRNNMKGMAIWLLKKVYSIDVDSLRSDNKKLKEENGMHVSRNNTLKKDKKSLSEKVVRMGEDNIDLQNKNQDLNNQIVLLQNQIKEIKDEFKKIEENYNSNISQVKGTLDETQQENAGLKKTLDEAKKEIESLKEQIETSPTPTEIDGDNEALDEIEILKRQYASLQELYEQAKEENKKQNARISKQDSTIENLKKTNRKQEETIESKLIEIAEIKKKLQSLCTSTIPNEPKGKNLVDELPPITVSNETTIVIREPITDNNSEKSKDPTKQTIDTVIDLENDKEIYAKQFFSQPEGIIFKKRTELEKAIYLHRPLYVCKYCGQMVKISGRKMERGMARFFSHLRDNDDCDYKTTTGRTRREINREKYARCNEGERHKFLKAEIAKYLKMTNGITNVRTENTVKGNHPILRWRRPDVIADYRGQEVAFELQLSTTFVSVIAERDLFYRLNKKHIIWISNFDEQGEHVDLTNMMVKDIYYNNRMNLFIFDHDAQRKSEELGELVLKCNWRTPDGTWQYPNGNTSDKLGGKFIRLSDLTFDNTYKPYFVDAEQEYYAAHPEFKIKAASIEDENKEILTELDRQWKEELRREETEQQKTEEKIQEIIEDNEIDGEVKPTKKYIIAQRLGQYGLITYDGIIRLPFIYDEIKAHRGWFEGKRNSTIEVFTSDYQLIDTDIRHVEKLGDNPKTETKYGEYFYYQARSLCEETKDKSKIDHNKAFRLFQQAARLGNADAQCCVGCCFKNGYGTLIDYSMAREWYDISAENGCARALRHIAMLYEDGWGVDKDVHEAIKWYQKAIDRDDKVSMEIMGKLFYYGRDGVPIDYSVAFEWYLKAAEAGNSDGMWRLGYCYRFGVGIEKDLNKAFEWYQKSANKGNVQGEWRFGNCYEKGLGNIPDGAIAKYWYEKAARQGHKNAIEALKKLESNDLSF